MMQWAIATATEGLWMGTSELPLWLAGPGQYESRELLHEMGGRHSHDRVLEVALAVAALGSEPLHRWLGVYGLRFLVSPR